MVATSFSPLKILEHQAVWL